MTNVQRLVAAGAVLIAAGVVVVLRQAITASPDPQLGVLGQWIAGAEFPGLVLICIGSLLWLLAVLIGP
jgi:hypothetical protein